jgi:MFS family permease
MFIATVPAVLWIDRLGRKPVLAVGAIGMGACHLIIAVILAKNINNFENNQAAGWGAICMVWLFVVHFGCRRIPQLTFCVIDTDKVRLLGSMCLDYHRRDLAS